MSKFNEESVCRSISSAHCDAFVDNEFKYVVQAAELMMHLDGESEHLADSIFTIAAGHAAQMLSTYDAFHEDLASSRPEIDEDFVPGAVNLESFLAGQFLFLMNITIDAYAKTRVDGNGDRVPFTGKEQRGRRNRVIEILFRAIAP